MTKVYGYSDDVVEIESVLSGPSEIYCFDHDVRICFADGTEIVVGYGKDDKAIWWIHIDKVGSASYDITTCDNEYAEIYSDVFEIESEVESWEVLDS